MSTTASIYLDYNASTPIHHSVAKQMEYYLYNCWGNPSSAHSFGSEAKNAVDKARKQVATILNCKDTEVIFTSGGSESNNYAIKGVAFANEKNGKHIITSSIEHPATYEVLDYLKEKYGFSISYIQVDEYGVVDLEALKNSINDSTILITIMHANNEVGTIQPIKEIVALAKSNGRNILVHTDASQTIGKIPVTITDLGVDLLTVTTHKFYGPKGIGALYKKEGVVLEKLIHGAGHEFGYRAGTENIILEVGLGAACELISQDFDATVEHMLKTRERLHQGLKEKFPELRLNGHPTQRLPNTLSVSFPNINAVELLWKLKNTVAASAGSACHSQVVTISKVLQSMKVPDEYAIGTVRFSTGRLLTMEQVEQSIVLVAEVYNFLKNRPNSPVLTINK